MSSRALRKLQKEQELEKQLAAIRDAETAQAQQDEETDEEDAEGPAQKPLNAFDMLDGMGDEGDEDEDVDKEPVETREEDVKPASSTPAPSNPKKKKKKARKKGKGKEDRTTDGTAQVAPEMDEIDRALKELSMKHVDEDVAIGPAVITGHNIWAKEASRHLAIDTKNLNPVNEMKSLFGNIAVESASSPRNQRRREQGQAQQEGLDLGTALSGRQCAGTKGKELGPLAHRKNIFMSGKDEWPGASSGGLSIELGKDNTSFEKKFNVIHDKYYRETQFEFLQAVATMQPQNLITLLRYKPYHIATLLQVSEIAKVQGDHSVSGDLLERALFNFGRAVQSSFSVAIKDGTARLGFSKSANRELYLSIWRYIRNLEQRGTWKTAFEWAKVLLQLDPTRDPYGVTLMIDQLALRGRQHAAFIDMCAEDAYGETWNHLPNIQISLALAHQQNKKPAEARQTLAIAIHKYSYILSELAKSLDIDPLPAKLWGKLPSTDAETLYTQLYVTRAKDLWNTPELTALLVEVAQTMDLYKTFIDAAPPAPELEISLEEARHIMLLEIPALIGLLPRKFTNMRTSMSDPLPPPDNEGDFTARAPAGIDGSGTGLVGNIFDAAGGAAGGILDRILGWFSSPAGNSDDDQRAAVQQLADEMGVEPEEAQEMLAQHILDQTGIPEVLQPPSAFDGLRGGDQPLTMEAFMARLEERDEDSDGSLPELESIPGAPTPPPVNPMAATVEEGEDDEDERTSIPEPAGAVLRHVDSDEDETLDVIRRPARPARDPMAHPDPTHTVFASTSRNPSSTPVIEPVEEIETTRDPQRIQRWLLSTGFDSISDGANMAMYVDRLKVLPKQQRDWTIRMVDQRGGKDLAGRVRAAAGD